MKIPKTVRACLKNNMPKWFVRIRRASNIDDVKNAKMPKSLRLDTTEGAKNGLGNYHSCIVGEFYGFNKIRDKNVTNFMYKGCGICLNYSHSIHSTCGYGDEEDFFWQIEKFCEHAKEKHPKMFKKVDKK